MTPSDRAKAIGLAARAKTEPTRERNRREMPETAKILDEIREVFGKPVSFRFTENGRTVSYP